MTCGIYMIQNKVNNKIYIGQAVDIERRWESHKYYLRGNYNSPNKHLQRAWNKYGEDNFEFTIICECDESQLNTMEEYYIFELMTYDLDFGYNKSYGGSSGRPTEETRRKISESNKGKIVSEETRKKNSEAHKGKCIGENHPMYGRHHTEEARKKISEAGKGRKYSEEARKKMSESRKGENHPMYGKHPSEETRKKISEANKGKTMSEEARKKISEANKGENHPNYGKHPSEETRRKQSESHKGKTMSEETKKKMGESRKGHVVTEETRKRISAAERGKIVSEETRKKMSEAQKGKTGAKCPNSVPVVQLTLDGELVKVYDAAMEAKRFGFNQGNISSCCRGERNTYRGYIWMRLADYKTLSEETIKKMCENIKGKNKHNSIPVAQLTLDGELVNVYSSAFEARENGFNQSSITRCVRGELKTSGGYKWMYLSDYEAMKKEG